MIKMKKNIALLLVLLVAGSAFAANPKLRKNSRTEMGINGNAIYVIEYTYNIHGGRDGGRQLVCIDSITFARPRLVATELGWWGTPDEGPSHYDLRYDDAMLGFTYRVGYHFEAHEGCCTSASCVIRFASDEQMETFVQTYLERPATDATNDPYIYVKETLTGPRKFELWTMSGPILPVEAILSYDMSSASGHCTVDVPLDDLLAGRSMADVRLVIEGWLYNPLLKADNPNYKPNE